MYFELFRANEKALRLLCEAQARAEQQLLNSTPPALKLSERAEGDILPAGSDEQDDI